MWLRHGHHQLPSTVRQNILQQLNLHAVNNTKIPKSGKNEMMFNDMYKFKMNTCNADTCKGIRCSKNKVNDNYCEIHMTNETCATCGSTQISSTDSILKRTGRSACRSCLVEEAKILIAKLQVYKEVQKIKCADQKISDERMRELNEGWWRQAFAQAAENDKRSAEMRLKMANSLIHNMTNLL